MEYILYLKNVFMHILVICMQNTCSCSRIKQLTKCESLKKLRVRLGPYKNRFNPPPPVIKYYCSCQGDISVVVLMLCFGVESLCRCGLGFKFVDFLCKRSDICHTEIEML